MIPLFDNLKFRGLPWISYCVIALNVIAFVAQWSLRSSGLWESLGEPWVQTSGKLSMAIELASLPLFLQLAASWLVSAFLHANFVHLATNMTFFYVFAPALEAQLGRLRFIAFCLLGIVAAAAMFTITVPAIGEASVGASGLGAAVIAAYAILWPRARITCLAPGMVTTNGFVLLLWFLGMQAAGIWYAQAGGMQAALTVAYWGHIGGVMAGATVAASIRLRSLVRPSQQEPRVVVPRVKPELYDRVLDWLESGARAVIKPVWRKTRRAEQRTPLARN